MAPSQGALIKRETAAAPLTEMNRPLSKIFLGRASATLITNPSPIRNASIKMYNQKMTCLDLKKLILAACLTQAKMQVSPWITA